MQRHIEQFEGIKVITVALEDEKTEFDKFIKTMPNWIHVYGKGKWQNEYAQSYDVNSTPSFFILDKDKKIINKPYDFEALKTFVDGGKPKTGIEKVFENKMEQEKKGN